MYSSGASARGCKCVHVYSSSKSRTMQAARDADSVQLKSTPCAMQGAHANSKRWRVLPRLQNTPRGNEQATLAFGARQHPPGGAQRLRHFDEPFCAHEHARVVLPQPRSFLCPPVRGWLRP